MRAYGVVVAISLAACGAGPKGTAAFATKAEPPENESARVAELHADEDRALDALAASDPRFAERVRGAKEERLNAASTRALAMGDADLAIEDGALDFFSFTARARSIEEAEAIVARLPAIARDANAKLERELLVRLVAEEHARLDEERALPRGASALVRGVIEMWGAPETPARVRMRDARVTRRLDELGASLAGGQASRVVLAELDDALDPLERIATPRDYPTTAQAIARLRVALGDATSAAREDDASWPRLQSALRAHLGVTVGAGELRARLDHAERTLRADAKARVARLHPDERNVGRRADVRTLDAAECSAEPRDSRLRSLPPSPERAPICGELRALQEATDETARLAAIIALHDDVVVALWSLALHEAHLPSSRAVESAHPFFGAQPEREARLIRYAAARPVAAIGAGLTASVLAGALDSDLAARWLAFGDAPFDLATAALVDASATSSSLATTPPPASLRP